MRYDPSVAPDPRSWLEVDEAMRATTEQLSQVTNLLALVTAPPIETATGSPTTSPGRPAIHATRSFAADPTSPRHKAELDPTRRVIVYCRSGVRAALVELYLVLGT